MGRESPYFGFKHDGFDTMGIVPDGYKKARVLNISNFLSKVIEIRAKRLQFDRKETPEKLII